jgi:hypothetical protein
MAVAFTTYDEADEARDPEIEMVCGVRMKDGTDRYFLMGRQAPDELVHDTAFEIREGREISPYERSLHEVAAQLRENAEARP